ncbi:MAG: HD domain-containing protein [Clostridia bacterium]|nr:HD domain-containing protein [Clostridia bacterium]
MTLSGTAVEVFYYAMFGTSLILMFIYLALWHSHFDVHLTLLYVMLPVTNAAYPLMQNSSNFAEGLIAKKLTYVGGCYFILLLLLLVFSLCKIQLKRWIRLALVGWTTAVFGAAMTIGLLPVFYKTVAYTNENGIVRVIGEYGVLHTAFYATIFAYLLAIAVALVYSYRKKKETSKKTIRLLLIPVFACVVVFFIVRPLLPELELIPLAFNVAMAVNLFIARRLCIYDVIETAADAMAENGAVGVASFDFGFRYLGSNETAKRYYPALSGARVDEKIEADGKTGKDLFPWLNAFKLDPSQNTQTYDLSGRIYRVDVGYLFDHTKKRGYQMLIRDDTERIAHENDLKNYNEKLQSEVGKQTAHIRMMNRQFVLGMATMVESRDNSTGGHIRRTSDGVRILTEELRKEDPKTYPKDFCDRLVRAAPMHDLGKIAVDDAVLRKPGRFTPEDFEKMKVHAAEGARIVRQVLTGTDDDRFRTIAENVAHYHHERWDGTGYPEGKKGLSIPLEARIMAVADVYDALVSKRVYKESMPFDKAKEIILEGMGKHFDPALESAFRKAEPKLVEYYRSADRDEGRASAGTHDDKEKAT